MLVARPAYGFAKTAAAAGMRSSASTRKSMEKKSGKEKNLRVLIYI
jgi:hypothetical protein